jgi:hypothetical protein
MEQNINTESERGTFSYTIKPKGLDEVHQKIKRIDSLIVEMKQLIDEVNNATIVIEMI